MFRLIFRGALVLGVAVGLAGCSTHQGPPSRDVKLAYVSELLGHPIHWPKHHRTGSSINPQKHNRLARRSSLWLKSVGFELIFPSIVGFLALFPAARTDYAPKKAKRRML